MKRIAKKLFFGHSKMVSSSTVLSGHIDGILEGVVQGWVQRNTDDEPMVLDLLANGLPLVQGIVANQPRPDVATAGFGFAECGFSCPLPPKSPDGSPWRVGNDVTLSICPTGQNSKILERKVTITLPTIPIEMPAAPIELVSPTLVPLTPPTPVLACFDGRLELVTASELRGWAVERTNPGRIVTVEVLIDDVFFREVSADGSRADLARNGLSLGKGGVRLSLPLKFLGSGMHKVSLRLPDGQQFDKEIKVAGVASINRRYSGVAQISPSDVAIIVPVYNAAEDVAVCIDRLAAHTPAGVEVLFINDASPDPVIAKLMARAAALPSMRVLHNDTNLGFTCTVNRGLEAVGRKHAILLNSDARVTPGWVEGMLAAAVSRPKVATVTPMSDRAGAFSAPSPGNDNSLPSGVKEITYARAFRRRGLGLYPQVPTGNGFCMFVNRACLDAVGGLDAAAFPRGYGEENDFCMRAGRAGWVHLVDDRTYVFHDRSKSFGEEKSTLIGAGRAVIDVRYPEYKQAIRVFTEGTAMALARLRARQALKDCADRRATLPRVLYVVAAQNGGTAQTNMDLMTAVEHACDPWLLRCNGSRLDLLQLRGGVLHEIAHHELAESVEPIRHVSAEYDDVVAGWIGRFDFATVHIRHLGFHSLNLPLIARNMGCTTVFSFHDFYTLCPSVKLMAEDGAWYGGDLSHLPGKVVPELWPAGQMPPADARWITHWRERAGQALADCDMFVTTSASARNTILRYLPSIDPERFQVIPHGRDFLAFARLRRPPRHGEAIRILVPGGIGIPKGLAVIRDLLEEDHDGLLEFHILGRTSSEIALNDPRVIRHSTYERDEFAARVRALDVHLGAMFSIWDETWCHTLTELWSAGIPAMVFDFPTVAGRVRESGAGWVLDHRDIAALYRQIVELAFDADAQDAADAAIAAWQRGPGVAESTALMGGRYLNLYRQAQGLAPLPLVGVLGNAPLQVMLADSTTPALPITLSAEALLANLRAGSLNGAAVDASAVPVTMIATLAASFQQVGVGYAVWLGETKQDGEALTRLRPLLAGADAVVSCNEGGLASADQDLRVLSEQPNAALWQGLFTPPANEVPTRSAKAVA